jgi:hypothetical protein
MTGLRERLEADELLFDSPITQHGFASFMRDYDVVIDVPAVKPDASGSYIIGQYRYRFTHCVEANIETAIPPETWRRSWSDEFTDYAAWEAAGNPSGFVWGVKWADAYPGASYVAQSSRAAAWTEKLGRTMHEIRIETNAFTLGLVCHDLRVDQVAIGDALTGELTPIRPQP